MKNTRTAQLRPQIQPRILAMPDRLVLRSPWTSESLLKLGLGLLGLGVLIRIFE